MGDEVRFSQQERQERGKGRKDQPGSSKLREKAILYAEKAPVIAYPGRESVLREPHFMNLITYYRAREAIQCVKNDVATEYEAFTYLHTASLATPLDREWYRIYFHLFKKFYGHLLSMDDWEDWDGGELSDYEKQLLIDLRKWIFKKQMRALSQMQKQMQRQGKKRQGKE